MWQTIGHGWVLDLLRRSIDTDRVAQATLLTGPEGIGKTHLAWEIAAALNCEAETRPCGVCRSCRLIAKHSHPDVMLIEPDGTRFKIEQVRDLQHSLSLSPVMGRRRVAILAGFEAATREAANALLKTLEEPPASVALVLTATDADVLLPTIVSRCRLIALRPVPEDAIAAALGDQLQIEAGQARLLARVSGGRPGWAFRAAQEADVWASRSEGFDLLERLLPAGRLVRLEAAEELAHRDDLAELLALWQTWWRDVELIQLGCDDLVVNQDRAATMRQAAEGIGFAQASEAVASLADTRASLLRNVNTRLALEVMLLKWQRLN